MVSKKGQVTLFIIIAVVIVAVVVLAVVLTPKLFPKGAQAKPADPNAYIGECVNLALEPMVETLASQGGYLEEPTLYWPYLENKVAYLCYTNTILEKCTIQHPSPLQGFIEEQLTTKMKSSITNCFNKFSEAATQQGYDVSTCTANQLKFSVNLTEGKINVPIECAITITKGEDTKRVEKIETYLQWPLYEELLIVNDIINEELSEGNFLLTNYPKKQYISMDFAENGNIEIYNITMESKSFLFAIKNYPR